MMPDNEDDYSYIPQDWPWLWAIRNAQVELIDDFDEQGNPIDAKLPAEIIADFLYLGSYRSVCDVQHLKEIGITHVLNLKGMNPVNGPEDLYNENGIRYLEINAHDDDGYPLLERHYRECYEFIQNAAEENNNNNNNKVVVHCIAGINRSGLIAATQIVLRCKTNVVEAVTQLRRKRNNNHALSNEGFQEQLVAFARKQGCLGPKPGTKECTIFNDGTTIPPESERIPPPDWGSDDSSC